MNKFFAFLVLGMCAGVLATPAQAQSRMAGSVPVVERAAEAAAEAAEQAETPAQKETVREVAATSTPVNADAAEGRATHAAATRIQAPAGTPKVNYVGQIELYKARAEDTMLTIGEAHGLGYVEIRSANPAADPWKPGAGTTMILPKMHLFPDAPRRGIVVNLSEMRMYYFPDKGEPITHAIGVGREGFSTPLGTTTVVRKTVDPSWRPTPRMRREDPSLPAVIHAGPDNPLGTRALYLGWPAYLLHGTNKPWGIGRRVSSGCVRMYNSAVEDLYDKVKVGTPVAVIRQPIKFGWVNDMLYIEAHPDEMLADQVERRGGQAADYKVPDDIFANLSRAAGRTAREAIDWTAVRTALRDRSGYPVPILKGAHDEDYFVTASMQARAGTPRFKSRIQGSQPQGATNAQATVGQVPVVSGPISNTRRISRQQSGFN